jgi:predicted Na+-dependent transporter
MTRLFKRSYEKAIPLIYENGSRNLSIAVVVAITSFKDQAILGVAACILAQFPISALFYTILKRHSMNP